jgi:hypothetical protein
MEVAKKLKIEWKPTKNFVIDRLPPLFKFYIFAPGRLPGAELGGIKGLLKEAFSFEGLFSVIKFIILGFLG